MAGAGVLLVAASCSSILDVKNPNNIAEDALANPAAAGPEANGALASLTRALSFSTLVYADATDEMDWIGSRDSWNELDKGAIGNFANEFADDQFKYTAEARYVADQAIVRLEGFDKAGTLASRADLMRSYIYGAVIYSSIADQYDDFAFSNKTVPAAPVGRANMGRLYDTAVGYLDKALAIATSNSRKPASIFLTRSSPPTSSAPARLASAAFSPCAKTSTRTTLPVPWGRTTVPRTIWSAWRGSTPRRMCASSDASNPSFEVSRMSAAALSGL